MHEVTQRCPQCGNDLPLDAYHPDKRGKRGHYCRECSIAYKRRWKLARKLGVPIGFELNLPAGARWAPTCGSEHGPVSPPAPKVPSNSYYAVHARLRKERGSASDQACARCSQKAAEWAYDKTDPNPLQGKTNKGRPVAYSADLKRYTPLCRPCHRKLDLTPYQPSLFGARTFDLVPLPPRPYRPAPAYGPRVAVEMTGKLAKCSKCRTSRDLAWFATDRSKASGRKSWCKECDAMACREKYRKRGVVKPAGNRRGAPRRNAETAQARYQADRTAALGIYGGACVQCGTTDRLEFDHVNGDGGAHRAVESQQRMIRRIALTGHRLSDVALQLLCNACHRAKATRDKHGRFVA